MNKPIHESRKYAVSTPIHYWVYTLAEFPLEYMTIQSYILLLRHSQQYVVQSTVVQSRTIAAV